ncbi:MAG TPA: hypothetical protein PKV86_10670, partial [Syntrophobacteraceae bacterium]|nr:hypothetical protein [Syntrophobacteraceae bacterium]
DAPAKPELAPLTKAMNDLMEVRQRIADQGQVVDDRLLSRERQLKALVKELESDGQNDELDAEMRSYEAKPNPTYSGQPKEDTKAPEAQTNTAPAATETIATPDAKTALSEREKAAKAKMFNALGKLAHLAGKNTRMNWTQEEEQQLLPIVIELFDGAMELGAVSFHTSTGPLGAVEERMVLMGRMAIWREITRDIPSTINASRIPPRG